MRIRAKLAVFVAIAVWPGTAVGAGTPSFSCASPARADEQTICRSPSLRKADARMASLFRDIQGCTAMGGHGANIDDQRAWLAQRSRCHRNASCLTRLYRTRIAEFAPLAAKARRFMRAEQCPAPLR
jgi:uncharacterized protein